MKEEILAKASKIKLLILDVDGVLTNGSFYYDFNGFETKAFNIQDGLGMSLLEKTGITIAIISGRASQAVEKRMQELSIKHVYQGHNNKLAIYEKLLKKFELKDDEVAVVGDDLPDLPMILRAGLGVAVANAVEAVKSHAHWQTTFSGGNGAVREVCDLILTAKNLLPDIIAKYMTIAAVK